MKLSINDKEQHVDVQDDTSLLGALGHHLHLVKLFPGCGHARS
ncbi:hypothetical protein [Polynucleobacter kasalickyi]|uniref:Uncharacterized protein n=1 Tax=Polynucleobacter kasalickyi TaxID=1938817 RepID=A0A1W1ZIE8_9BURK|nr:hypothetical protein [Polynucleobacter kasalickyi]SMC48279.1 hypothetical protein SAMN06296008_105172 [Polynucleobacter kasalickyi]